MAIFVIAILLLISNVFTIFLWFRERREMLDRLMAKTFEEFKSFNVEPAKPVKDEPERYVDLDDAREELQ